MDLARIVRPFRSAAWAGLLCALAACAAKDDGPAAPDADPEGRPVVDATEQAGLDFVHDHGATGHFYFPEMTGSGVALFDYDPNGTIAPFWDDLSPNMGGSVHAESFASCPTGSYSSGPCFVAEWNSVPQFSGPANPSTFQGILYPSGAIEYQYSSSVVADATAGIENHDGTDGLTYACNVVFAMPEAVRFSNGSCSAPEVEADLIPRTDTELLGSGNDGNGSDPGGSPLRRLFEVDYEVVSDCEATPEAVTVAQFDLPDLPGTVKVKFRSTSVSTTLPPDPGNVKISITYDTNKNRTTVQLEGPDQGTAEALWTAIEASGGVAVADGQLVLITEQELSAGRRKDSHKYVFESGLLTSLDARAFEPATRLSVTATNEGGSSTAKASPNYKSNTQPLPRLAGGQAEGAVSPPVLGTAADAAAKQGAAVPETFVLGSNYPNPFNPATTITYGLPEAASIRLAVYDVQGRQVRVLFEGMQPAGWHEVRFEAGELPSGVYLYRMDTPRGRYSGSMLLAK